MRLLFTGLMVLFAAVVLALLAKDEPGYVLIQYRDWTIESSLVLLVVALALAFLLLTNLLRLYRGGRHLPGRLSGWRRSRRLRLARQALGNGYLDMVSGRWERSERRLLKHIGPDETATLQYLCAARAAQQQGAGRRRDYYLQQAYQSNAKAEVAVALTQVELLMDDGKLEEALAIAHRLRQLAPKNPLGLELLARLYQALQDWERLAELAPQLRRHHVMTPTEIRALQVNSYRALLRRAGEEQDKAHLQATWQRVAREVVGDPVLIGEYVNGLLACRAFEEAEAALYQAIQSRYDDGWVYRYGLIPPVHGSRQLARAESWLREHPEDPLLLLTLGRLCRHGELWGKARQYLEASAALRPLAETYSELAFVLEQMGEQGPALEAYRKGMAVLGRDLRDSRLAQDADLRLIVAP